MAPTMQDVARASGYSRAAVSMALRGDPTIPEATRRRIADVAERLGYRPNPLVAALMSLHRRRRPVARSTTAVAYLMSTPRDNFEHRRSIDSAMQVGAAERAAQLGYRLEPFNLRADRMTGARMRQILLARAIHAAVVAPLPRGERTLDLDLAGLAAVGLGLSVAAPIVERVSNDHFQSAALAVTKCVERGYRRIGFVLSQETSERLDHRWLGGFRFAVAQHGLETRVPPLMTPTTDALAGAMPAWLKRHPPDVVILCHVEPRLQARVPLGTGLVGLAVESRSDRLSGIYQNYALIGRVAVEHAIARLNTNSFGPLEEAHLHLVAGTWVEGGSTPGPGIKRARL